MVGLAVVIGPSVSVCVWATVELDLAAAANVMVAAAEVVAIEAEVDRAAEVITTSAVEVGRAVVDAAPAANESRPTAIGADSVPPTGVWVIDMLKTPAVGAVALILNNPSRFAVAWPKKEANNN